MATPRSAGLGLNFITGILGFVLFGVVVLFLTCTRPASESLDKKRASNRLTKLDELRKQNGEKLHAYAWIDQKAGVAQIPIERAMELAVVDLKNKKVGASDVKVEVPYPVGLAAPAAAPAPTPVPPGAPVKEKTPQDQPAPKAVAAPTSASPAPAAPAKPVEPPKAPAAPAAPSSSEQKSSELKK